MDELIPKKEINKPTQLLVEGKEEELFFGALVNHLKLSGIQIREYGGKDNLSRFLKAFAITPGFEQVTSLGVVRDADKDADGAFKSVCSSLKTAPLSVPSSCLSYAGTKPRVIVLILPGNSQPGALEDLCLGAVKDDPAMECVDIFMTCVEKKLVAPSMELSKAKVHVFLASRKRPDLRLGEAAQASYWPWDSQAFTQVMELLQSLCSPTVDSV